MKIVCETDRLIIRQMALTDVDFIIRIFNDKTFIKYVSDKNIRTQDEAEDYLLKGPIKSYKTYGFGLNLIVNKSEGVPIGICGLLKREELEYPDLGYAQLPEFFGKGYISEAAEAVLNKEMDRHSLHTVLAIALQDNLKSHKVLEKLGFSLKGLIEYNGSDNNLYEYRYRRAFE